MLFSANIKKFGITTIALLLCAISCVSNQANTAAGSIRLENGKPHWYWKPNTGVKTGGVGISGMHIRGRSAQRELAIQRAIDDISRQLGVKVKNFVNTKSSVTDDYSSSSMNTYSIQTVEGTTVTATIKEIWEDTRTDELYIWMVVK